MTSAKGTANGKVILSGEHSVVYGYPGLVSGISLGVTVEVAHPGQLSSQSLLHIQQIPFFSRIKNLFAEKYASEAKDTQLDFGVEATLPVGVGLGSSAAAAAATLRALAAYFDVTLSDEQLFELVQESEKFAHGTPSGIDATAVVKGGLNTFQKSDGKFVSTPLITQAFKDKTFFLINSGKPNESSKDVITFVREHVASTEKGVQLLAEIGEVTTQIQTALEANTYEDFLELVKKNEYLLEKLGVVSQETQELIQKLHAIGASAKITGAGGKTGGSGMLLVFHQDIEHLKNFCTEQKLEYIEASIT